MICYILFWWLGPGPPNIARLWACLHTCQATLRNSEHWSRSTPLLAFITLPEQFSLKAGFWPAKWPCGSQSRVDLRGEQYPFQPAWWWQVTLQRLWLWSVHLRLRRSHQPTDGASVLPTGHAKHPPLHGVGAGHWVHDPQHLQYTKAQFSNNPPTPRQGEWERQIGRALLHHHQYINQWYSQLIVTYQTCYHMCSGCPSS